MAAADRRAEPAPAAGAHEQPRHPAHDDRPPVPRITLLLMAVFLVGGSLGLLADWPAGPANLDCGVWLLVYGGYLYVVAAAVFYARTGR